MELIRKFGRAGGKKLAKARGRGYYVKIGKRGARVKKRKAKQRALAWRSTGCDPFCFLLFLLISFSTYRTFYLIIFFIFFFFIILKQFFLSFFSLSISSMLSFTFTAL